MLPYLLNNMSYRPKNTKERIIHRLKITQGHLKKVQDMVEGDEYCINIIHQSQAIQKALKEIDHLVLEEHLKGCVSDAIKAGKSEDAVLEVMEILRKAD